MWMKSGTVSVTGLLNFTGYDAKLKINDIFAPSFETGTESQVINGRIFKSVRIFEIVIGV